MIINRNTKHKHSKQNIVDHLLLVFVILSFLSGVILDHILEVPAQDGSSIWLRTHIAMATLFTILSLIHFKHHWGWFRTLPRNLRTRKKDSLFLLLALITLIISGVLVTVCKTHVSGFIHALFGILCFIISIYHFYMRHVRRKK